MPEPPQRRRDRTVCSIHPIAACGPIEHQWWARALRERAVTLAAVFAVDLLAVAVSDHAVALVLRCRGDAAAQWSDEEACRRIRALRAARNLFAHAESPGVLHPHDMRVHPLRARATLADDVRYRRALIGWVARRRRAMVGREIPIGPAQVTMRTSATEDPAPIAATLLLFLAWSEERHRVGSRMPLAAVSAAFRSRASAADVAALVGELRRASITPRSSRPRSAALRELLGDERFDALQRLAVGVLNEPLVPARCERGAASACRA